MTERASMTCVELFVFEDREHRLGVRMGRGDKTQRVILTEREADQLMSWMGRVSQRVISDAQKLEADFDVDLLRDKP